MGEYETIIQIFFPWLSKFSFYVAAVSLPIISYRSFSKYAKFRVAYAGAILVTLAVPRVLT